MHQSQTIAPIVPIPFINQLCILDLVVTDGYSRKKGLVQPLLVLCVQGRYFWQGLPDLS